MIGSKPPLNVGHRGAKGLAPENTLAAFRSGLAAGADGLEFDVQRTVDGHLVVFHDDDLKRVAGTTGRVVDSTLERLRELDAGSHFAPAFAGEPIPTMDEVIESVPPAVWLNIEAKRSTYASDGLEATIVAAIERHGLHGRCLVSSFNPLILWRLARMDPRIALGFLVERRVPLALGRAWPRRFLRVAALHPNHRRVSRDLVKQAHRRGLQVNTWTVNEPQDMVRLIELGVDAIITDRPDLLAGILAGIAEQ